MRAGPGSEGPMPVDELFGKEYSHTNWFSVYHTIGAPSDPNTVNVDDHNAFWHSRSAD